MGKPRTGDGRTATALTALSGGALALSLLLVLSLLGVLFVNGLAYFWPEPIVALELADGEKLLGQIQQRQEIINETEPEDGEPVAKKKFRIKLRVGNRDLTGEGFRWIRESNIVSTSYPADALLLERLEWGPFYGYMTELREGEAVLSESPDMRQRFSELHREKRREFRKIHDHERGAIGTVNHEIEQLGLELKRIELKEMTDAERASARESVKQRRKVLQAEYDELAEELFEMREAFESSSILITTADGTEKDTPVGQIVRALRINELGLVGKVKLVFSRIWEFVSDDPRESNTEGGIYPAIFGTVLMVFLMSFAVTPLGVMAAVYLREYAKQGPIVRVIRIAVNNLAGVPSIVFGVFGLGFFVYAVGGSIDALFYPEALPTPTFGTGGILWASLTLALLTVPVVIVATEEGLAAVPRITREGSLALGATKAETVWKVVVPAAAPGILTGMILAMARAAGEVAPLMIVGMVKLAPVPVDRFFPYVHFDAKFMHLGFHIYDVGFQSPDAEATKPLVFATALLLITIVTAMNLVAIGLRNHLRRKNATSAV